MIRYEDLQNAVDAIAERDPEIGYALNELMAAHRISVPVVRDSPEDDPAFIFDNDRVVIRKVSLFSHGIPPLEERLVLKYGELVQKHALESGTDPINYFAAAKKIRQAGLEQLVRYEILRAAEKLQTLIATCTDEPERAKILRQRLNELNRFQKQRSPEILSDHQLAGVAHAVNIDTNHHACLLPFPFSWTGLQQVAEINLEFFFVRFVLDLFVAGLADRLYAAITQGKLTGLMLIKEKKGLLLSSVEVKYIATINGVALDADTVDYPRIRGLGTFMIAGAWLLWKAHYPKAAEIVLDAEAEASRFYATIGFDYRPPYGFVLKKPKGKLLLFIVALAMNHPSLNQTAQKAVAQCIERQLRYLKRSTPADDPRRKMAIMAVSTCTQNRPNQWLAQTIQSMLQRYWRKIPEGERLLQCLTATDDAKARDVLFKGADTVAVVCDAVYEQHLNGIFHLESAKRIRVLDAILNEAHLSDHIVRITPRAATEEELSWVHHPDYIAAVAATAGGGLGSFDLDTQTTAHSYATAKLAVGGIFSLIDTLYTHTHHNCAMACVRPPGHHAEADHAMGFCLFNNPALAAMYLKHRHQVQRVLIADMDVHHGNGTQHTFYDSAEVLYFSIHQFPHYPGTGKLSETGSGKGRGYTVNVPLSKGRGDKAYAKILHFLLAPIAKVYQPEIIVVALGFDLYPLDPLGQMNVSEDGYALITHMLKQIAQTVCNSRILFILEGGYSLEGLRTCGRRVFQELAGIPTLPRNYIERVACETADSLPELKKAIEVHRKYWPVLS